MLASPRRSRFGLLGGSLLAWIVLAGIVLAGAAPLGAAPATPPLRVGFTTFENPATTVEQQDPSLQAVRGLLAAWLERSQQQERRPTQIDLVLGNYYQVQAWLTQGQIDAAVLSPFMAALAIRGGHAVPLLELGRSEVTEMRRVERADFCSSELPVSRDGHWPLVAARRDGRAEAEPLAAYRRQVLELGRNPKPRGERFALVSHLSTSGFLAPVALARQSLSHEVPETAAFWDAYFADASFIFEHSSKPSRQDAAPPAELYRFSYSNRDPQKLRQERLTHGLGCWQAYWTEGGLDQPPIPNDLLVVGRAGLAKLTGSSALLSAQELARRTGWLGAEGLSIARGEGYRFARPIDGRRFEPFQTDLIDPLFRATAGADEALARRFRSWFEDGELPFKPADLMRFLVQDQIASQHAHLAVVLPGGGVKSAYQAEIFDRLWDGGWLRNAGGAATEALDPNRLPIAVHSYVGTSGGALMGLQASQLDPRRPAAGLSPLWRHQLGSSRNVFPFWSPMRWLTVGVLLLLLGLALLRFALHSDRERAEGPKPGAWVLGLAGALPAVLAPLAVALSRPVEDDAHLIGAAGAYALLLVQSHRLLCCGGWARRPSWSAQAALLAGPVVLFAVGLGLAKQKLVPWTEAPVLLATLTVLGFVALEAVTLLVLRLRGALAWDGSRRWAGSLLLVLAYVATVYALLAAAEAGFAGTALAATLFEVNGPFAAWLLGLGTLATFGLGALARSRRLPRLAARVRDARRYLTRQPARGRLPMSPLGALLGVFWLGLGWWCVCLVGALYDGSRAYRQLERSMAVITDQAPKPQFFATLAVTASALREVGEVGAAEAYPAGPSVFCFPAAGAAPCPPLARWHGATGEGWRPVLDPVFASASPFPVFPPRRVEVGAGDDRHTVPLVDGGFAHLEPLEAARQLGARQVLLLRSQPDPAALRRSAMARVSRWPSPLARGLGSLVPFLFEHSQELDRSVVSSLVVAVIEPHPDHGAFPPLTDFRPQVVERMIDAAEKDWGRQVGRVESWGLPVVYDRIDRPREGG